MSDDTYTDVWEQIGVSIEELDESSECPECDTVVDISMSQAFVEIDGELRVYGLMFVCPNCPNNWTETRGPQPTEIERGGDARDE